MGMAEINANNYYEGILQLRDCTSEVVAFARKRIESESGVWIAKEAKVKGGMDFYLSSNKFLKKMGKILALRFSGIVKSTSKLHTEDRQSSKKVYRGTILFRMPSFQKGDVGVFRGDECKVISVADQVVLKNTKSGQKKRHKFDEVNKSCRQVI